MRSYENLQYAFQQLELAARYRDAGKLDEFIRNTGSLLTGDEDFLYASWYELLNAVADFVDIREDEDTLTCRMYFSDAMIRDYFCFAQRHAEEAGIPLRQDPYYLDALSYFNSTMLDRCPYSCWFRLVTQTHHEYGFGLSVWAAEEQFTDWEPLLASLLEVMTYFRSGMEILKAAGKTGQVTALPHPAQADEGAA